MQRVSVGGTKGGIVTKGGPGEYGGEERKINRSDLWQSARVDTSVHVCLVNTLAVQWPWHQCKVNLGKYYQRIHIHGV
jgi:hypothetical protein